MHVFILGESFPSTKNSTRLLLKMVSYPQRFLGNFDFKVTTSSNYPAVGDFVMLDRLIEWKMPEGMQSFTMS